MNYKIKNVTSPLSFSGDNKLNKVEVSENTDFNNLNNFNKEHYQEVSMQTAPSSGSFDKKLPSSSSSATKKLNDFSSSIGEKFSLGNIGKYSVTDAVKHHPVRHLRRQIQKQISKNNLAYNTVHNCGYPYQKSVDFSKSEKGNNLSFIGIQTCKSVWACPTCRSTNLMKKQNELEIIVDNWTASGGFTYMVTYTVQHNVTDKLSKILGNTKNRTGLLGTFSILKEDPKFKGRFEKFPSAKGRSENIEKKSAKGGIKNDIGYVSSVRGLECTHGSQNGFHAHIHEILFLDKKIDADKLEDDLFEIWKHACKRAYLRVPTRKRAIKISDDFSAAKYIAKFTAPSELSSESTKKAKNGNLSIHYLETCLVNNTSGLSDQHVKKILAIYYKKFKGKRHLTWSGKKNFKKDILDKYNDPLTEKKEPTTDYLENYLASCSSEIFSKLRDEGQLGIVKSIYELYGIENVKQYINDIGLDSSQFKIITDEMKQEIRECRAAIQVEYKKFNDKKKPFTEPIRGPD